MSSHAYELSAEGCLYNTLIFMLWFCLFHHSLAIKYLSSKYVNVYLFQVSCLCWYRTIFLCSLFDTSPIRFLFFPFFRACNAQNFLFTSFYCSAYFYLVYCIMLSTNVESRVSPFRKKIFFAYKRNKANLDPFHLCFTISL